jgi:hypothetical protein
MNRKVYLVVCGGVITLIWAFKIFRSPVADGFDGYYYVMQMDHLLRTGSMHSRDFSFIYLPLRFFCFLFSPLISYKLTQVMIALIITYATWDYSRRWESCSSSYVAVAFLLLSPSVLFFLLQFPKNLLGTALLLLFAGKERHIVKKILLLGLIAFAHRLSFCLAATLWIWELLSDKKKICHFIPLTGLLLIPFFIPGLINIFDFKRIISDSWNLFGYWGQISFMDIWQLWDNPLWIIDFITIHSLIIGAILLGAIKKKSIPPLFCLSLLLIIPLWNYETGSLAYRLFMNGYLLLPLLAIPILKQSVPTRRALFSLALYIPALLLFPAYDYTLFNPPITLYQEIAQKVGEKVKGKSVDLIIAHKGIKEQIILNTKKDALNWMSDETTNETYRVFTDIPDYYLIAYCDKESKNDIIALPGGYYLMKEIPFQEMLNKIKNQENDDIYRRIDTWKNPLHKKPSFL